MPMYSGKNEAGLAVLGQEDIQTLIQEKGHVEIKCDFCNEKYTFDAIDIALLFHKSQL